MLSQESLELLAKGMDQRSLPATNTFSLLQNVAYDSSLLAWSTSWGWEPVRPWFASRVYTSEESSDIYSGAAWYQNSGAIEYLLQERLVDTSDIGIFYETANGTEYVLANNRTAPGVTDAGTQYIPFGRFIAMLNGVDPAFKFWGDILTTPFGISKPPTPRINGVDPTRLCPDSSSSITTNTDGEATNEGFGVAMYPNIWDQKGEWSVGSEAYKIPSGYTFTLNANQGAPLLNCYWGLGTTTALDRCTYSYKVAWVTDTGSESESSAPVTVSWTVPEKFDAEADNADNPNPFANKLGVMITDLPIGPDNVVGRRLYRTKNQADGLTGLGAIYYQVVEIQDNVTRHYVDFVPDNELLISEPGLEGAISVPSTFRYGAAFDGRMWLAGGTGTENLIYYSERGRPEQYGAFSFFDVGVRDGGAITGIYPYSSSLLVFRDRAVDIITQSVDGNYQITNLHPSVGTTATNTIQNVPGFGVMFLSYDGIYVVSTQNSDSKLPSLRKISSPVDKWMQHIQVTSMAKATAVYSSKWNEYWCHFPADGSTVPNSGVVFNTTLASWSVRGPTTSTEANFYKLNRLFSDRVGNVIICPEFLEATLYYSNIGLQIVSRAKTLGWSVLKTDTNVVEGGLTFDLVTDVDATSKLISSWATYNPKGKTYKVELRAYQTSSDPVRFHHFWDSRVRWNDDYSSTVPLMVSDEYDSTEADWVWGPSTIANVATQNTTIIAPARVTNMRFDFYVSCKSSVAWGYQGTDIIQLQAYKLSYNADNTNTLNQTH
jgi:hypothetical protein